MICVTLVNTHTHTHTETVCVMTAHGLCVAQLTGTRIGRGNVQSISPNFTPRNNSLSEGILFGGEYWGQLYGCFPGVRIRGDTSRRMSRTQYLRVAVMICLTLVNTQTHTQTHGRIAF